MIQDIKNKTTHYWICEEVEKYHIGNCSCYNMKYNNNPWRDWKIRRLHYCIIIGLHFMFVLPSCDKHNNFNNFNNTPRNIASILLKFIEIIIIRTISIIQIIEILLKYSKISHINIFTKIKMSKLLNYKAIQ